MASPPAELEDLVQCSCCRRAYDERERRPKVLSCKHHFCLECVGTVLLEGRELHCPHCWKRTAPPDDRPDALPTHAGLLELARRLRAGTLRPAPPTNAQHASPPAHDDDALRREISRDLTHAHRLLDDLQRLVFRQRDFLLKILDACTTLKTRLEAELVADPAARELAEAREALEGVRRALAADRPPDLRALLAGLAADRERLRARHRDAFLQCRLDDLIRGARVALDFELLQRALTDAQHAEPAAPPPEDGYRNPVLFLANYCMSQLYSRHCLAKRNDMLAVNGDGPSFVPQPFDAVYVNGAVSSRATETLACAPAPAYESMAAPTSPNSVFRTETLALALPSVAPGSPLVRAPSSRFPLYYFDIEVNGSAFGRIVIEVRDDVAPRMARNFAALTTGECGVGYRGCAVFQCWENESVITGDFESNNGRGGRSAFEESYFVPDDTRMVAVRGGVGMRRGQKRHDGLGLVGSQFRVILREMRGFTGIFGFVVEGLELVDRLSQTGDGAGKPHSSILIASCGKLN